MHTKTGYRIFIFNLWVSILGLALFGYWHFIDGTIIRKPLEFYMDIENMEVEKEVYAPGEDVRVYTSFCKNRNAVGVSTWSLVDTIVRFYPEKRASAPIGCYGVPDPALFVAVSLPPDLVDGIYYLEGVSRVKINPVKTLIYHYKTEEFIIKN